jgi:hypothetical protein
MIFSIDSDAVTLAAANVTKSALGTAKLINGFYNPSTSGVNAYLLRCFIATKSGTPGGPFFYNFLQIGTSSTLGTAAAVVLTNTPTGNITNNYLAAAGGGAGTSASQMIPEVNVALTATGSITTALNQLCTIGGPAAVAAGAGIYTVRDDIHLASQNESLIIVPPGTVFGLMCTAAGTTHIVQSTIWWKEVPA